MLPNSHRVDIVDVYTQKLINSRYSWDQTGRIIIAGIKGYESKMNRCVSKGEQIHKSAAMGAATRNKKKLTQKSAWFKDKKRVVQQEGSEEDKSRNGHHGGGRKGTPATQKTATNNGVTIRTTSVLFVDQTPGGELARRLRQLEQRLAAVTGWRVQTGASKHKPLGWSLVWQRGLCSLQK